MAKQRLTRRVGTLIVVLALLCGCIAAQAAQKTCSLCGGSGRFPCSSCTGGRIRCVLCGGTGQKTTQQLVPTTTYSYNPITGMMTPTTTYQYQTQYTPCSCSGGYTICLQCMGTGFKSCAMCGGSGKVFSGDSGSGSGGSGSGDSGSGSGDGGSSGDSGDGSGAYTGDWSDGGFSADSPDPGVPYAMKNGTVLAATKSHYDFEGVKCLFDGDRNTKYCTITTSAYIVWQAPKPIAVSGYEIMTGNDNSYYNGRNPKSWVLYGSNSRLGRKDSGWVKLHGVTNDRTLKDLDYKTYSFTVSPAAKTYQYFKLEILENCGDGCIQMSEFTLKGTEGEAQEPEPAKTTSVTVKNLKFAADTKARTAVFTGPSKKTVTKLVVPATVKADGVTCKVVGIKAKACKGLANLASLSIGKYVTEIGNSAFDGCGKLKTVTGGAGVETIGKYAFRNCAALAKFTFGARVKTIGAKAFYGCGKLKTLVFKTAKLTSAGVGANAFAGTYKKAAVTCPKSKLTAYKKLLVKKGVSEKATFR